ncbi:MAG: hypothetical protein IT548_16930 [Alphaproteobacteria bacterium]|nr:hypothetical protein [Alphaproteobacteria bacterium]
MKRFALVFAALAALPLSACGGSEAPAVQEARVEEARLKDFVAFFPKPLNGWKAGQPVFSTADDKSSVAVSQMTDMGDIFTMTITFSNAEAATFQKLIDDEDARRKAGVDTGEFGGKPALVYRTYKPAAYVVVASPSRTVSIVPVAGDKIMPIVRAQFEKIDFAGIAAK